MSKTFGAAEIEYHTNIQANAEPCYLLGNETGDDISSMNINGAHGHDFLPAARAQFSQQQADERVQLGNLM